MIVRHSLVFLLTAILSFSAACSVQAERVRIAYSAISGVQLPLWVAFGVGPVTDPRHGLFFGRIIVEDRAA